MMYEKGFALQAMSEIRECLRLDQDNKQCMDFYKKIKKVSKVISSAQDMLEEQKYSECIDHANQITKLEPHISEYEDQSNNILCHCHAKVS